MSDLELDEDAGAPANLVSSGQIAGAGGESGEPGVDKKKKRKTLLSYAMFKRKTQLCP